MRRYVAVMTFREGGRFEGGRVRKSSGRRGGVAVGGGVVGLILVVLISQLTGVDLSGIVGGGDGGGQDLGTIGECNAEQANTDPECRLSATLQALDAFWVAEASSIETTGFEIPYAESFAGSVDTACGTATSEIGPFYCPPDQGIYLDLGFFDVLRSRFGASSGNLAEMYVVAHEYGHHIQNVTGYFDRADRSGTGEDSDSVRLELQADCLAGMWIGHAATVPDPDTGVVFLEPISAEELRDALSAAAAVGDDRIQSSAGGGIDPDSWTHGSSEQRQDWFTIGYERADFAACDTFEASSL